MLRILYKDGYVPWELTAPLKARMQMAMLEGLATVLDFIIEPFDYFKTRLEFRSYGLRDKWCMCENCEERRAKGWQKPYGK